MQALVLGRRWLLASSQGFRGWGFSRDGMTSYLLSAGMKNPGELGFWKLDERGCRCQSLVRDFGLFLADGLPF
jgi:hypothetical protein